jgi:hypothetical protein
MFTTKLECRKVRKPKIEKLRRARINQSLESLKEILLRNTISIPQGSRPTKLEKADILEMTVRYVSVLHERLSISSFDEKISRKAFGNLENIPWHSGKITNSMDKQSCQQETSENKMLIEGREDSENCFDKENFDLPSIKRERNSTFGEHWRPW